MVKLKISQFARYVSVVRNKGVFFVKRETEPLPSSKKILQLLNHMTCGDIHPNSLEHFCALVEEVMVPILKNEANMAKFPQCISDGRYGFLIPLQFDIKWILNGLNG